MTPQGAIEIIKIAIAEVEWNYPMEYAEAFEYAISVLEKQIPKKPISKVIANEGYAWQWACPNCHIEKISTENAHCSDCGQALDWSEEE
jgi:hypothetical protein